MTEEKFISVTPNGGQGASGWSPADFAAVMGNQNRNNNGGLWGNGGMWDGVLGLFGLGIVANMFGYGNGNGFGFGGNNQAAAGYLANMENNNYGREILMQQITGVGNRVTELAQAFNTSIDAVQAGLANITLAMTQLAAQNNMSVAQLQMALQKGQSDIALQFCNCCKDQALAMCQQTNTLVNAGTQNTQRIVDNQNQNTQRIVDTQGEGFRSILQQMYNDKLEAKNEKIQELTALALSKDGEISQMKQNQYFAGLVGQSQAQTDARLNAILAEVEAIKRCQPATMTLPDNRFQAVPTGIASIGSDFIGTLLVARLLGLTGNSGSTGGGGTDGGGTTPTQG